MGSWDAVCALTNTPIVSGEKQHAYDSEGYGRSCSYTLTLKKGGTTAGVFGEQILLSNLWVAIEKSPREDLIHYFKEILAELQ